MSAEDTLSELWNRRQHLTADRHLLCHLAEIRRLRLPGCGMARRLESYLTRPVPRAIEPEHVSSVEVLKSDDKKILLIGLETESRSAHEYVADRLRASVEPVDVFLHYPYTKDPEARQLVKDSYVSRGVFQLARAVEEFGDQIRFHYCDLRLEWLNDDDELLFQRLKLLGDYSDYLFHGSEQEFETRMVENQIDFNVLLDLDRNLVQLEGKVMKSYAKADKIRDHIVSCFRASSKNSRARLDVIREEIRGKAVVPVQLYIEFIGELNHLYEYLNAAYTMMRMFRHFAVSRNQHSGDPVNCVVMLPQPVVALISECLHKMKKKSGGVELIDAWFAQLSLRS
jgi:hypothetical protein